ncbi:hypothetical protein Asch02_02200 [Acinetobacter schindleri]
MLLKGNNAEKIAISIIIFFVLFVSFVLISIAFKSMTHSSIENMVKDGMGFAATGLTPIIAFLLFIDWRESHVEIRNENVGIEIYKFIIKTNNELDNFDLLFRFENSKVSNPRQVLEKMQLIKSEILEKALYIRSLESENSKENLKEYASTSNLIIMDMLWFINLLINMASVKVQIEGNDNPKHANDLLDLYKNFFIKYKDKSLSRMKNYEVIHSSLVEKLAEIMVKN